MSYHDSNYHSSLREKGMAVVNPLHTQQKRLAELEGFLKELASQTDNAELQQRIENILK
jgi:23S rRNA A2030 N6-methylase RlmJ|tara:strand:+ start:303 stop:479 length:177 start_codon:yes stop_codon:yes gene_type:complete